MDLHEDIHRAIEAYFDANEFRRFLNAAIQDSRSVTFLLQKRKSKWKDFEKWYTEWQTEARSNPVLTWGVNSRNRIVKEEDLLTYSKAIISYYGERLKEAEQVIDVPPQTTVADMMAEFAYLIKTKPAGNKGWIRVQRRWVDDQLPEYELIAALREMYSSVANVVRRAHLASGIEACLAPHFSRPCVDSEIRPILPCLGPGDPIPSGIVDINTGEFMSIGYRKIEHDDTRLEELNQRYGKASKVNVDAIDYADARMETSKRFLEADGYSGPMLLLFRGVSDVRVHPIVFGKTEPRELKIAAAVESEGAWPFDGAVFASEIWIGSTNGRGALLKRNTDDLLPSNHEFFNPDETGNRDEALYVEALSADGRSRLLIQPFARTKDGYTYGEMLDQSGEVATSFLRPVWKKWPLWNNGQNKQPDPE